jgi:hypothetical protein
MKKAQIRIEPAADPRALEAVAFAILSYLMIHGRAGNILAVTGACSPAILSKLMMSPPDYGLPMPYSTKWRRLSRSLSSCRSG